MLRLQLKKLLLISMFVSFLLFFAQLLQLKKSQIRSEKQIPDQTITRLVVPGLTSQPHVQQEKVSITSAKDLSLEREMELLQQGNVSFDTKMTTISDIRHERLNQACIRRNLTDSFSDYLDISKSTVISNLMVSDKYKVMYCANIDVHSENWKKMLEGESGDDKLRPLSSYRQESISYRIKYYYKLLLIQHPMVKLISAYKSWLLPHPGKRNNGSMDATFKNLQDLSQKLRLDFDPENFYNREPNATKYARLSDFVEHIINKTSSRQSLHPLWERIHFLCQPCSLRYNYIARAETALEDTKYLLSRLEGPPVKERVTGHMESSDAESITELRKSLTSLQADKIYSAYKTDFELFGYFEPWN